MVKLAVNLPQWIWTVFVFVLSCSVFIGRTNFVTANSLEQPPPEEDGGIECYSCNSLHDPHCGDPFNNYSIGTVRCGLLPAPQHLVIMQAKNDSNPLHVSRPPKPVVCRKLVQFIQNHTRVVRGCGYIEDDKDDIRCVDRSGTKDIKLKYCACTKSLCNTAKTQHIAADYTIAISSIASFFFAFLIAH